MIKGKPHLFQIHNVASLRLHRSMGLGGWTGPWRILRNKRRPTPHHLPLHPVSCDVSCDMSKGVTRAHSLKRSWAGTPQGSLHAFVTVPLHGDQTPGSMAGEMICLLRPQVPAQMPLPSPSAKGKQNAPFQTPPRGSVHADTPSSNKVMST